MIKVENLSYRIGNAEILTDVSIEIPGGGITALVGPNGAGKSTLLSLVARLLPIQTGRIQVDDLVIGDVTNRVLAKKLSILSQSTDLSPRLTVRDLIGFGRFPYHQGRPREEDHAKVQEAIETFDLEPLQDRFLETLSGGQRQRAYVAMCFAQDTQFMLLDEPLNNLDIASSRSLMKLLQQLARNHDRTIVIVLHDINYACGYSDWIVALKDGQITRQGTPTDVVSEEFLRTVFSTDATVAQIDGQPIVRV